MNTKAQQDALSKTCKRLLAEQSVSNQKELKEKLMSLGFTGISQSTVSRLLSQLGVVKTVNTKGKRIYCINAENAPVKVCSTLQSQIISISHNSINIVIKTNPGCAQLIARLIDIDPHIEILGTVAGNDTIIIVPRSIAHIDECELVIKHRLAKNF